MKYLKKFIDSKEFEISFPGNPRNRNKIYEIDLWRYLEENISDQISIDIGSETPLSINVNWISIHVEETKNLFISFYESDNSFLQFVYTLDKDNSIKYRFPTDLHLTYDKMIYSIDHSSTKKEILICDQFFDENFLFKSVEYRED